MKEAPFIDIKKLIASKSPRLAKWLPGFILRYLKRILHQDEINVFLAKTHHLKDAEFCDAVLDLIKIKVEITGLENIPKDGPVILAMNHPLGGMDAIAVIAALKDHRIDLRFIVNDLLMNLPNLSGLFVGINKHGKNESNVRQSVTQVFESNYAVCIFPAGLVSRKTKGIVKDLEWKKTFVSFGKRLDNPIVPIHIDGELSNFFYRLSNFRTFLGIKTNIEMLYLADEMFRQKGKTMKITVGKSFHVKDLIGNKTERDFSQDVKEMVYELPNKK